MISAQTIAPGTRAGADHPYAGWGDLEGWAASGAAGRLLALIRDLIQDPGLSLSADGDRLPLPEREVTLRKIAMRCGVRSPSSAAGWVKSWRAEGLLDPGPPPVVDLARLRAVAAPVRSDASPQIAATGGGLPEALDVLLAHLRAAHHEGSEQAAARIEALSGRLIDSFTARCTARLDARSETVRKIEIQQKNLTNFLVSAEPRGDERTNRAMSGPASATERGATSRAGSVNGSGAVAAARCAPRDPARGQRTTDETLVLLEPMLEWVRSRSLGSADRQGEIAGSPDRLRRHTDPQGPRHDPAPVPHPGQHSQPDRLVGASGARRQPRILRHGPNTDPGRARQPIPETDFRRRSPLPQRRCRRPCQRSRCEPPGRAAQDRCG